MIIGIDASRANRLKKTGVEWYAYYLIQELKKIPPEEGDKFILYAPEELKGDLGILPPNWQIRILSWPLKHFWTQIRLAWELSIHPPDLFFTPSYGLPLFCRVKSALTVHDLGFERFPQLYSPFQRLYYSFIHRYSVKRASKIIVPSEFTKKELIELYKINPDKIKVIPLGYNQEVYKIIEDKAEIKKKLVEYGVTKPYFLYVGRLEKKKNIKNLLEAYNLFRKKHSEIQLVLAGQTGYGYREVKSLKFPAPESRTKAIFVRDKQVRCGASKVQNILEIGHVNYQDLPYLYAGAEAFVFPSFYEGFGIPLLEAMACNCPVLAAKTASLPEVAGEAALYFDPKNPAEIAAAMKKIIEDNNFKNELREKGREQVKKYSWQKCAEETFKILKNVI